MSYGGGKTGCGLVEQRDDEGKGIKPEKWAEPTSTLSGAGTRGIEKSDQAHVPAPVSG